MLKYWCASLGVRARGFVAVLVINIRKHQLRVIYKISMTSYSNNWYIKLVK